MLLFVSRAVLFRVAAVAIMARKPVAIVDAAGEIAHRRGQLAAGFEVAADAVGFLEGQRIGGVPALGKFERLFFGLRGCLLWGRTGVSWRRSACQDKPQKAERT